MIQFVALENIGLRANMIPETAKNWRVSLFLRANTRIKVQGDCEIRCDGILAETFHSDDAVLSGLRLTCGTERSFLPKIDQTSIVEVFDPNRSKLVDAALRFEGMFATFGMIDLSFATSEWAWYYDLPSVDRSQLYFKVSTEIIERPVSSEPMEVGLLGKLTELSLQESSSSVALTLSLFRQAENYFHDYRYIDAIRSYCLALEHECAGGKTGKAQATDAMKASTDLADAVSKAGSLIDRYVRSGDIPEAHARSFFFDRSFGEFVDWLYRLRGGLFHQSGKKRDMEKWQPSEHIPHKCDSIILRAIVSELAMGLILRKF